MITWTETRGIGNGAYYREGHCLSTDAKPSGIANGSSLIEMDTGKIFFFDQAGRAWVEFGGDGGDGGGDSGDSNVLTFDGYGAAVDAPAGFNMSDEHQYSAVLSGTVWDEGNDVYGGDFEWTELSVTPSAEEDALLVDLSEHCNFDPFGDWIRDMQISVSGGQLVLQSDTFWTGDMTYLRDVTLVLTID